MRHMNASKDVLSHKQAHPRNPSQQGLWSELQDLLVRMDEMGSAAPTGLRAQLAEMDSTELMVLGASLEHRVLQLNLEQMARWVRRERTVPVVPPPTSKECKGVES